MSDTSGGGGDLGNIGGLSAAELDGFAIGLDEMLPDLLELDHAATVDDALALIDRLRTTAGTAIGSSAHVLEDRILADLADAYRAGTVPPNETGGALSWVLERTGKTTFTGAFILAGSLAAWLALWGASHGHPAHSTPTHAPAKAPKGVVVGGQSEGTRTPGGRMVGDAQRGIRRTTISAPGLSAVETSAISSAIATSYGDVMFTLINLTNALQAQINSVGELATEALSRVRPTTPAAPSPVTNVSRIVARIEAGLSHLSRSVTLDTTRITNIERVISRPAAPAPVIPPGVSPKRFAGLVATVAGIEGRMGGLAPISAVQGVQDGLSATEGRVAGIATELQTAGVPNLPTSLEKLQECCDDAHTVTNPIKSGGATPSLLSQLGGLLTKAYAIGIVVSVLGTVFAILDMPAAVLGTIRGAEWVMPLAERAAVAAMGDISWGDTVAGAA